jgi:hypothetical protein
LRCGDPVLMSKELRHAFWRGLWLGLGVAWPVLAALLCVMMALGLAVAVVEGWRLGDGLYFAFVSGLTIGYGDLVPKSSLARVLAISIGLSGILLSGLVVAVGVQAVSAALRESRHD